MKLETKRIPPGKNKWDNGSTLRKYLRAIKNFFCFSSFRKGAKSSSKTRAEALISKANEKPSPKQQMAGHLLEKRRQLNSDLDHIESSRRGIIDGWYYYKDGKDELYEKYKDHIRIARFLIEKPKVPTLRHTLHRNLFDKAIRDIERFKIRSEIDGIKSDKLFLEAQDYVEFFIKPTLHIIHEHEKESNEFLPHMPPQSAAPETDREKYKNPDKIFAQNEKFVRSSLALAASSLREMLFPKEQRPYQPYIDFLSITSHCHLLSNTEDSLAKELLFLYKKTLVYPNFSPEPELARTIGEAEKKELEKQNASTKAFLKKLHELKKSDPSTEPSDKNDNNHYELVYHLWNTLWVLQSNFSLPLHSVDFGESLFEKFSNHLARARIIFEKSAVKGSSDSEELKSILEEIEELGGKDAEGVYHFEKSVFKPNEKPSEPSQNATAKEPSSAEETASIVQHQKQIFQLKIKLEEYLKHIDTQHSSQQPDQG